MVRTRHGKTTPYGVKSLLTESLSDRCTGLAEAEKRAETERPCATVESACLRLMAEAVCKSGTKATLQFELQAPTKAEGVYLSPTPLEQISGVDEVGTERLSMSFCFLHR